MFFLNVSIVLYKTPFEDVRRIVLALRGSQLVKHVYLIDNSPARNGQMDALPAVYVFNGRNLGYGAAHNIAIRKTLEENVPFHLVVNADVQLQADILELLLHFMHKNSKIGLLVPKVFYPDGEIQYLCKLLPTPLDLWGRRFLPAAWMRKRMERFELRGSGYDKVMNVPYLSGCFMLFRAETLRQVGLFDERFFLYPEDMDMTRRIHRCYETVFYPEVSVIHVHGHGSYKSLKLLWVHIVNMCRYFNKWGWFWDKERRLFNRRCLDAYIPLKK